MAPIFSDHYLSSWHEIWHTCFAPSRVALRPQDVLQIFWQHYAPSLQRDYPGISSRRLIQEWQSQQWKLADAWYFFDPAHPLSKFLVALRQGVPWGYHFGRSYFYETEFWVGPATLIPRPETELLVDFVRKEWQQKVAQEHLTSAQWLDVGTGCGNILLSLLPYAQIPVQAYGSDISPVALQLAQQNAFGQAYRWPQRQVVTWAQSDRFQNPIFVGQKFDLITANPPYLKQDADRDLVHGQVKKFEPWPALFLADQDYEAWFAEFFLQVAGHLAPGGIFAMEGHPAYLQELAEVATTKGLTQVKVLNDLTGRSRFLMARGK